MPFVLALVVLGSWSLASPIGSTPDDNFHLSSIWCAQGVDEQTCAEPPGKPTVRLVPDELAGSACYAFDATASARCQSRMDGVLGPDVPVEHGNWNGGYPPLFYRVMSYLVVDDAGVSVVAMRMANSVILVGLIAGLVWFLPRRLRRVVPLTLLLTSVPLGLSVYTSTNPSAWTLVMGATLWIAFYGSFEVTGRRRSALLAIAAFSALLGAGSRADAGFFVLMSVAIVLLLRWRAFVGPRGQRLATVKSMWWAVLFAVVAGLVSAWGFRSSGQSGAVSVGFGQGSGPYEGFQLLWVNAVDLPVVLFGSFGLGIMGGIGWLDTPFNTAVGFLATAAWAAMVFLSWRWATRLRILALLALGGVLVGYPLYMLQVSQATVGTLFQPRYVLPVLIIFTGVSLLGISRRMLSPLQVWALVLGLGIAQALALFAQIRRYVTGNDVVSLDLSRGSEWWWSAPWPITPQGVWIIGSVAFLLLAWIVVRDTQVRPAIREGRRESRRFSDSRL